MALWYSQTLSTPLALLPPTLLVTLANYYHHQDYYYNVVLTSLLLCVCVCMCTHVCTLNTLQNLMLSMNFVFVLIVQSSAWQWHSAGMNWKSEWLCEHKDRWQKPQWNVWPVHGCYLFSLSRRQQTHCHCTAAGVRFTSRTFQDSREWIEGVTWTG